MVAAFYNDPVKLAAAQARYVAKMHPPATKPVVVVIPPAPIKRDYIHVASNPLPTALTVKQIITDVADAYGVAYEDVVGPRRSRKLLPARFAAYYAVATARPDYSLNQIARHFGRRDHTTILNGLRKVRRYGIPLPVSQAAYSRVEAA